MVVNRRSLVLAAGGALVLAALGFAGWPLPLTPAPPATATSAAVAQAERQALLAALASSKRSRPLIAVVGLNDGMETADYLMPCGMREQAPSRALDEALRSIAAQW